MIRLTYLSTARPSVDEHATAAILAASRRNNRVDGLTGLLLFDGRRFLQALEGQEEAVLRAFKRITADPRHYACVELSRKPVRTRAFADWNMAWRRLAEVDTSTSLGDTVDRMVAQVEDVNTRALFSSFARVERPAA